jgi:hypothetical protein
LAPLTLAHDDARNAAAAPTPAAMVVDRRMNDLRVNLFMS